MKSTPLVEAHEAVLNALHRYGQEIANCTPGTRPSVLAVITHPVNREAPADFIMVGRPDVLASYIAEAAETRPEPQALVLGITAALLAGGEEEAPAAAPETPAGDE